MSYNADRFDELNDRVRELEMLLYRLEEQVDSVLFVHGRGVTSIPAFWPQPPPEFDATPFRPNPGGPDHPPGIDGTPPRYLGAALGGRGYWHPSMGSGDPGIVTRDDFNCVQGCGPFPQAAINAATHGTLVIHGHGPGGASPNKENSI